jgi:hypothetical protein
MDPEVEAIIRDVDLSDPQATAEAQKKVDELYEKRLREKYRVISKVVSTAKGDMGKGQYAAILRFDREMSEEEVKDILRSIVEYCEDIKFGEFDPNVGTPVFYVP